MTNYIKYPNFMDTFVDSILASFIEKSNSLAQFSAYMIKWQYTYAQYSLKRKVMINQNIILLLLHVDKAQSLVEALRCLTYTAHKHSAYETILAMTMRWITNKGKIMKQT